MLSILLTPVLYAQDDQTDEIPVKIHYQNKGKFFGYWGWNWSWYSKSDIRFQGDEYDFTLSKVRASDRQSEFSFDTYFNPKNLSIPQVNYRIGYYFAENYSVSFGVDHMKYVTAPNQYVPIEGTIDKLDEPLYNGIYEGEKIQLTGDFLAFEHTDGLNYVSLAVDRHDHLANLEKYGLHRVDIFLTEGLGGGILYPKTAAKLMDYELYDAFHVAGYGVDVKLGIEIRMFDYFFIRSELKGGYINMPDIRTTSNVNDKASQQFCFAQANVLIGFLLPVVGYNK